MFVEEFQRTGKTIFEAVDLTTEAFGGEVKAAAPAPMDPDEGVAQLNAFLGGAR